MAIVDVVKWNASSDVYAWKFPSEELSTWTQLIVSESQEALLLKEGRACGPFPAGRHTLDTANIPGLTSLVKIPMGGKSPFSAEVWFVNKAVTLDVKWGTSDPIQLQDPKYNIMLPVRAFGQCGMQVNDTLKFLVKLVGTMPSFDRNQMTSYFRGVILTHARDIVAKRIIQGKISILEISAHLADISSSMQEAMRGIFDDFGIKMVNFFVHSINTPEDDPAVKKLKEALARKAEMSILGFTYQQERSFDTLEAAAANPGSEGGGVMGAGIGLGMGFGLGGAMGGAAGQMAQNLQVGGRPCPKCGAQNQFAAKFCNTCGAPFTGGAGGESKSASELVCDKCGTAAPEGSKFCPKCGDPYILCPACKADNEQGRYACRECGAPMPRKCGKCNAEVPGTSQFCPSCGNPLVRKCTKCNTILPFEMKFCSECGTPVSSANDGKTAPK